MTQNRDRKQKIRARMAATGEPYTEAARAISASTEVCGHEYVLGGVAYGCERAPHPIDGYGPAFRHAAQIDEELAEGTDEDDGHGPATLVTWGEDGQGEGQDWEIDWGTVEDYPARRQWRGTLQPSAASAAAGGAPAAQAAPELDVMENGRYDDDFTADRHADLDAGEFGGAMTDADYYDRISGRTEAGQRCPDCGGRGWKQTPDSESYDCRTCGGEGYVTTTDPDETADLVGQLIGSYREHVAAEAAAVPGRVRGEDVEGQADALADAAGRLLELLTAFAAEPKRSMDVIAVFRGLQRASASMAAVAAEMRAQEWVEVGDDPEAVKAWDGALEGLRTAEDTYKWVADGWI